MLDDVSYPKNFTSNRQLLAAIVMLMQDNSILSQSHGVENLTELWLWVVL